MRNHQSCPTGSEPFPEVNVVTIMVLEGIFDTKEFIIVIIKIHKKEKPLGATKSGIIPR